MSNDLKTAEKSSSYINGELESRKITSEFIQNQTLKLKI